MGGAAAMRDRLGSIDRVTLVCPDRPGLLQDIAGLVTGDGDRHRRRYDTRYGQLPAPME